MTEHSEHPSSERSPSKDSSETLSEPTRPGRPGSEAASRPRFFVDRHGRVHATLTLGRTAAGVSVRRHVSARTHEEAAGRINATAEPVTTGAWLQTWLDEVAAIRVRPQTLRVYRSQTRTHILPTLGAVPLVELTIDRIEGLFADMSRAGASPHTVRGVRRMLLSALSQAERRGHITSSPASGSTIPRSARTANQRPSRPRSRPETDGAGR